MILTPSHIKNLSKALGKIWLTPFFSETIPYKYIFLTTYLCNSKCRTCFIWKIYREKPELLRKELTLNEYEKLFKSIRNFALWINFSGGEPFLRKDFERLVISAAQIDKKVFLINVPTNGLATSLIVNKTKEILENIRDNLNFSVTVSLDGLGNNYRKIRGINGFHNVIETFKKLKKIESAYQNFSVDLQCTLSKFNLGNYKLFKFIMEHDNLPIFTVSYENQYFNNIGKNIDIKKYQNSEDLISTLEFIEKYYPLKGLENIIPKIFLKLLKKFLKNPKKQILPCQSTVSTITVDPYGNIVPCSYWMLKIENVKNLEYNLPLLFKRRKEKIRKIRNLIKQNKCPVCWTNCEAFPTIFSNPFLAFLKAFL